MSIGTFWRKTSTCCPSCSCCFCISTYSVSIIDVVPHLWIRPICLWDLIRFIIMAGHLRNPRSETIMKGAEGCMTFDGSCAFSYFVRVVLTILCVICWFWNMLVYILDKRRLNILVPWLIFWFLLLCLSIFPILIWVGRWGLQFYLNFIINGRNVVTVLQF